MFPIFFRYFFVLNFDSSVLFSQLNSVDYEEDFSILFQEIKRRKRALLRLVQSGDEEKVKDILLKNPSYVNAKNQVLFPHPFDANIFVILIDINLGRMDSPPHRLFCRAHRIG